MSNEKADAVAREHKRRFAMVELAKSYDNLLSIVATLTGENSEQIAIINELLSFSDSRASRLVLFENLGLENDQDRISELMSIMKEANSSIAKALMKGVEIQKKGQARKGGKAKDISKGRPEKRASIRTIWASGKYSSRDICAEEECAALGMSFSMARKALRNTPEPDRAK